MARLKLTSWNVQWLDDLLADAPSALELRRLDALCQLISQEIHEVAPDVLCRLEGPAGEAKIERFCKKHLADAYVPVKASDGKYAQKGRQSAWFLVRPALAERASLLPPATWDALTAGSWKYHRWGEHDDLSHRHHRHPQVLVLDWQGTRIEIVGLHRSGTPAAPGARSTFGSRSRRASRWRPRPPTSAPTSTGASSRRPTRRSSWSAT